MTSSHQIPAEPEYLDGLYEGGAVQVADGSGSDVAIARSRDEGGKPANLELQACVDEEVRSVELDHHARLGLHEVGVLGALHEGDHVHAISADAGGQVPEVRDRRDNSETGEGRLSENEGGRQGDHGQSCLCAHLHTSSQYSWAPCAPADTSS